MTIRDIRRAALEFLKTVVIAFILAQVVMTSVTEAFQVEQFSMEPSLLPHDRVLVNKFIYRFRIPHPGEIVVLRPPTDPNRNYIKRIVAVERQIVSIRNGSVYIDGQALAEPYLHVITGGEYGPRMVPPHDVFVLGDNRGNSEDSRFFGFVPLANVIGEAVMVYWPLGRVHFLE